MNLSTISIYCYKSFLEKSMFYDTLGNRVAISKQFAGEILSCHNNNVDNKIIQKILHKVVAFRIHKMSIKKGIRRVKLKLKMF